MAGDGLGAATRHGAPDRGGQAPQAGTRGGRFGRMFPYLPVRDPGVAAIDALVAAMQRAGNGKDNRRIPAGYTYLGQFIDHDITFDTTSRFERDNDPVDALVSARTPRFDLDSLYGSGPADQPFLYDWSNDHPGVRLLLTRSPHVSDRARMDLQRNEQERALIGDPRNDENLIVSQLHLLFLRFHNAVVEHLLDGPDTYTAAALFDEARRLVRWHYQWIIVHEFLDKIVGKTMAASVTQHDSTAAPGVTRRPYPWRDEPYIPVEFSGAAFRFAHSMIRPSYTLNACAHVVRILPDSDDPDVRHLGGHRILPPSLEIEWPRFFFKIRDEPETNQALKIDERLAAPLYELPVALTRGVPQAPAAQQPNQAKTTQLARLNLHRGRALGLPAGGDVARALGEPPLTETELFGELTGLDPELQRALAKATPLWFYIVAESRLRSSTGDWLGPVGGAIVAEVLVGLLEGDQESYVRQDPLWKPELPGTEGEPPGTEDDFTMLDLVRFVELHE